MDLSLWAEKPAELTTREGTAVSPSRPSGTSPHATLTYSHRIRCVLDTSREGRPGQRAL